MVLSKVWLQRHLIGVKSVYDGDRISSRRGAIDNCWNRKIDSLGSPVINVARLPISWTSSTAQWSQLLLLLLIWSDKVELCDWLEAELTASNWGRDVVEVVIANSSPLSAVVHFQTASTICSSNQSHSCTSPHNTNSRTTELVMLPCNGIQRNTKTPKLAPNSLLPKNMRINGGLKHKGT